MTETNANGSSKPTEEVSALPAAVLDKYKASALVAYNVLKELVPLVKEGANVLELVCRCRLASVQTDAVCLCAYSARRVMQRLATLWMKDTADCDSIPAH